MRIHLVSALLLLLCLADLGYSYQCYTCTMALSDASCKEVSNCSGSTPYCGTAVVNGFVFTLINKFCSASCASSSLNLTYVSATESCCASDLCNDESFVTANNNIDLNFGNGAGSLSGGAFLLFTVTCFLGVVFAI